MRSAITLIPAPRRHAGAWHSKTRTKLRLNGSVIEVLVVPSLKLRWQTILLCRHEAFVFGQLLFLSFTQSRDWVIDERQPSQVCEEVLAPIAILSVNRVRLQ